MFSLILTFCTISTCEEYVIDHNLTREDCYNAMHVERNKLNQISSQGAYRSYMEQFNAEGLFDADSGVAWELACKI